MATTDYKEKLEQEKKFNKRKETLTNAMIDKLICEEQVQSAEEIIRDLLKITYEANHQQFNVFNLDENYGFDEESKEVFKAAMASFKKEFEGIKGECTQEQLHAIETTLSTMEYIIENIAIFDKDDTRKTVFITIPIEEEEGKTILDCDLEGDRHTFNINGKSFVSTAPHRTTRDLGQSYHGKSYAKLILEEIDKIKAALHDHSDIDRLCRRNSAFVQEKEAHVKRHVNSETRISVERMAAGDSEVPPCIVIAGIINKKGWTDTDAQNEYINRKKLAEAYRDANPDYMEKGVKALNSFILRMVEKTMGKKLDSIDTIYDLIIEKGIKQKEESDKNAR